MDRLLDSVILIDHFNGIDKASRFLNSLDPLKTAISVITRAEILAGIAEEQKPGVLPLLDQYQQLIIDKQVADLAAELRKAHRWKLPDAFQAALALHHKITLTTRNTKDFDPQQHHFVDIPYLL